MSKIFLDTKYSLYNCSKEFLEGFYKITPKNPQYPYCFYGWNSDKEHYKNLSIPMDANLVKNNILYFMGGEDTLSFVKLVSHSEERGIDCYLFYMDNPYYEV